MTNGNSFPMPYIIVLVQFTQVSQGEDDGEGHERSKKIVCGLEWVHFFDVNSRQWFWYCEAADSAQIHEPMEPVTETDDPCIEPLPIIYNGHRLAAEWDYDKGCWIYVQGEVRLQRIAAGIPQRHIPDVHDARGIQYKPYWSVDYTRLCWIRKNTYEVVWDDPSSYSDECGNQDVNISANGVEDAVDELNWSTGKIV